MGKKSNVIVNKICVKRLEWFKIMNCVLKIKLKK
jgi:hypothetical protein